MFYSTTQFPGLGNVLGTLAEENTSDKDIRKAVCDDERKPSARRTISLCLFTVLAFGIIFDKIICFHKIRSFSVLPDCLKCHNVKSEKKRVERALHPRRFPHFRCKAACPCIGFRQVVCKRQPGILVVVVTVGFTACVQFESQLAAVADANQSFGKSVPIGNSIVG